MSVNKLQAHIKNFGRMRQSTDRDVIHTRAGNFEHMLEAVRDGGASAVAIFENLEA